MPADLVVTSHRIVTPDGMVGGAVVVENGKVAEVIPGSDGPDAPWRLDAGSCALLPGVLDTHVHVNEPGRTDWEGFASATRAAAAGGVTTIVDMPLNSIPPTTSVPALNTKAAAALGKCAVDYGFWGGVVPGNLPELDALIEAGVLGFKCFLVPSGVDEFPCVTADDLRTAMEMLAGRPTVLLVHAEARSVIERAPRPGAADAGRYAPYVATRPPEAELEAIDLVTRLSLETGCAVHIVHLSAAEGADLVAAARARGAAVTVETCPHYLTFCAEEVPDGAVQFKCAPPIRDAANRERLWEELRNGRIHLVASDHSPAPPDRKRGDFLTAWGGIASLQLVLPAVWTGGQARGCTLRDLARWMAEAPAKLAGLDYRKGRIAPGYDADLVIFDDAAQFTVDAQALAHRHRITPYHGLPLHGIVRDTFVRGVQIHGSQITAHGSPPPDGRRLRRRGQ